MHTRLNGEPLEEVDYFQYLGSQVVADGGCEGDMWVKPMDWRGACIMPLYKW